MKAFAITNIGIEHIAQKEIIELIKPKNADIEESIVIFEPKDLIDLCSLCYKAQSLSRVLILMKKIEFKDRQEIFEAAKDIDFSSFITKKSTFRVVCERVGEHDFNSAEIEQGIGKQIKGNVDLDSPDVAVHAYIINNKCYIGIDFSGFDLSKRQYRIFTYKDSLKATIAYALLRIADYKKEEFLVDPFCGSGTITVEAGLYACSFPVNYFNKEKFAFRKFDCFKGIDFDEFFGKIDKKIDLKTKTKIYGYDAMLGYVKAGQKNAKIAGINKKINMTRADIEWLDTKIKEKEAEKIVTYPPQITERNRKEVEKLYKEFFYQTKFVLKKKGLIVMAFDTENALNLIEKYAAEHEFKTTQKSVIMQGKKELRAIVIQK